MNFQTFIETYNGKYIDFDGVYGFQCFDLLHTYLVEVLGLTDGRVLAAPAAKDVFNNFDNLYGHEYFERIPNTPDSVPNEGDIIVWGFGTWGHVGIFVEGNINNFRGYEQNYPLGSPCHIQSHTTYNSVLGWLRFKNGTSVSPELQECQTKLAKEIKNKNETYQECQEWKNKYEEENAAHKKTLENLDNILKQQIGIVDPTGALKVNSFAMVQAQMKNMILYEDQLREANKKIEEQGSQLTVMTQEANEMRKTIDDAISTNRQQEVMLIDKDKEVNGLNKKVEELTEELAIMEMPYKPLIRILKTKYWLVKEVG